MRNHWIVLALAWQTAMIDAAHAQSLPGKARFAREVGQDDRFGLAVARERAKAMNGRTVSAVVGLWSDDRSVEFGAFEDRGASTVEAGAAQTVRMMSGRGAFARGVRFTGALHGAANERGWSMAVDARHQRTQDVEATLRGDVGRMSESRLSLTGKLRF